MSNHENGHPENEHPVNDHPDNERNNDEIARENGPAGPAARASGPIPEANDPQHGHRGRGHRHGERGEHDEHGGHGGRGRHGGHGRGGHHHGAQTFRRGRAVAFLEELRVKRDVLRAQLNDPDMGIIKEIVSGELKAVDEIIKRFMHTFELHETNE